MVNTVNASEFSALIAGLFEQKKLGGPHSAIITATIRERALTLLSHGDVRYMPAFKILDLLAAFVNMGAAMAEANQLRANEIHALLRESLSDTTPLIREFMLEAALERARYEPLMLQTANKTHASERQVILDRRWAAMRAAHQENAPLPDAWMEVLDITVDRARDAEDFSHFRHGPLLQMFAEMLALARNLHQQGAALTALETALTPGSALWRRYALKSSRYREKTANAPDLKHMHLPFTIH